MHFKGLKFSIRCVYVYVERKLDFLTEQSSIEEINFDVELSSSCLAMKMVRVTEDNYKWFRTFHIILAFAPKIIYYSRLLSCHARELWMDFTEQLLFDFIYK